MPDPKPQSVEVTQADRDAAAEYGETWPMTRIYRTEPSCFRAGLSDEHRLIQLLARHRIARVEEARRG